jgi:hypothetical protein
MFRSAAINDIEIEILGIDTHEWDVTKDHKLRKLYALNKFVTQVEQTVRVDDLVLFCDASDVVFFEGAAAIINAYNNVINSSQSDNVVVFGAERSCWPYMNGNDKDERMKGGRDVCQKYPTENASTFKFLNSGLYMSTFGGARNLLAKAMEILEQRPGMDDQLLFHRIFLAQHGQEADKYVLQSPTIILDTKCILFQNGHKTFLEHHEKWVKTDRSGPFYNTTSGRIFNTESGTEPLVAHFNGRKTNFLPIANQQLSHLRASNSSAVERKVATAYESYVKMYSGFKICSGTFGINTNSRSKTRQWFSGIV